MEGLIHRVSIYRRVTASGTRQWEITPFVTNYRCRLDPVSPNQILREVYASCTHKGIGDPRTDIDQGMKMVVTSAGHYHGKEFHIAGVIYYAAGSSSVHQNEYMLTEVKL